LIFIPALRILGVEIWIDGGWGVDALLGEQSRSHQDLDIAIEEKDVPKLKEMLCGRGYKEIRWKTRQGLEFRFRR